MRVASIRNVKPYNNVHNNNRSKYNQTNYFSNAVQADIFVLSKKSAPVISFKGNYERTQAEAYIDKIEASQVQDSGRGYQASFYKLNENTGIKAPNPLFPNDPNADKAGLNNIKEYFALNNVKAIDSDIAVNPVDLIQRNNKNYLVMDLVKGTHPINSGMNQNQLKDILQKTFKMDTNGMFHCDLQSENVFLVNEEKAKFIDFGAFNILENNGSYIDSDVNAPEVFSKEINGRINSPRDGRFMATYYNNQPLYDIKNYSDNPYLRIKSNASNFEYRTLYYYLDSGKEQKPVEFFKDYLKNKSENYHNSMIEYLEKLDVSKDTPQQFEMHNKAIETEKVFKEVFANPSDDVLKAELGKIQLKWLMNNHQGGCPKAFDAFQEVLSHCETAQNQAQGSEKTYFEAMVKRLGAYSETLNEDVYKGAKLDEKSDIVKKLFNKVTSAAAEAEEAVTKPEGSTVVKQAKKSKAAVIILALVAAAGAVFAYLKLKKPNVKK